MKHILVVDDDPATLRVVTRVLATMSYRVTPAASGLEALDITRAQPVDLIVTDYRMPGMTGRELIDALRQERPAVKTLLVTAFADDMDATDPEWWNAQETLRKPFQLDSLKRAVERLIGAP